MQNNPQLAQVLNDPATMRQYLDMARNPEAMNQARRSQDLMMSQIENQPGGFNALRRLYTARCIFVLFCSAPRDGRDVRKKFLATGADLFVLSLNSLQQDVRRVCCDSLVLCDLEGV
ncbi:unnamed protein product [Ectocarpus sp. CCAP 1310/34]|nr:unnamed protein product [Ectocarpus sp. CCAP 1310/34]